MTYVRDLNSICRCYIVDFHPLKTTSIKGASIDRKKHKGSRNKEDKLFFLLPQYFSVFAKLVGNF